MSANDLLAADSIEAFGEAVACELSERAALDRIRQPLKSRPFQTRLGSNLSPRLSYGRHRGPARLDSRRAAVVIAVYPHRVTGQMCLTLTRRPTALAHHGGQICLPGGRIESGETPQQAALREYHEELGVPVEVIQFAGFLSPIYVFASDNLVETLIVTARRATKIWQPDPVEVDQVIEMPLESLLQLSTASEASEFGHSRGREILNPPADLRIVHRKKDRIGKIHDTGEVFQYGFGCRAIDFVDCEGQRRIVWGATAMLLCEFAGVVSRVVAR